MTALNQSITASDDGDGTSEQLSGLIETNADIQPGDSGGALVDTSGNVLGIDTAASAGLLVPVERPVRREPGLRHPDQHRALDRPGDRGRVRLLDRPHR